jgi:energy-converting hydrogenase Eha subunit A
MSLMRRRAVGTVAILVVAIAAIVSTRLLGVHGFLAVIAVGAFAGLFSALLQKLAGQGEDRP